MVCYEPGILRPLIVYDEVIVQEAVAEYDLQLACSAGTPSKRI